MNRDNHLIFEAFVNAKGAVHVNRPALQEEINTAKADLNKDKQLSDYELARAKAMDKAMHKDEQAEGAVHAFTVVSGGVDNTSDVGFDINPADHMKAQSLKHAVQKTIEDMQNDEDFDGTFPEEYREYVKDIFIMSNDNGDFVAVLPGHLSEDQIFDKLVDVRDNSENKEENAEGLSDQEYHKARKDAYEGAGEELGHGSIKVQLKKDTTMDCYKAGTVQGVRFAQGTIFNCDENVGDYYECDTEEYGGIAVFPEDVTVLSGEENAESADERKERVQRGWDMNKKRWAKWKMENPEAAAKHAAKKARSEEAEHEPHGYPQGMTAIQNLVLNQLKKHGFKLNKISHVDKERDKYPTVFMMKSVGPMHNVAEISGMGQINGEPYQDYLANLKNSAAQ